MKEKFLQFFTGKMGKSVYIAAASAVVCVATVAGSTVAVHNHNKKIDTALESLAQAESITETVTESAADSVSASGEVNTQQNANSEPAGDKALQYIAEYDKLTAEYQAKREKLLKDNQELLSVLTTDCLPLKEKVTGTSPEASSLQAKIDSEYESKKHEWEEKEKQAIAVQEQIDALDNQYEKDVVALKARYGIS